MKKVLLTSTALFALSGAAAFAEITLSGEAEMGVAGGQGDGEVTRTDAAGVETTSDFDQTAPAQFWNDVDVTFTMAGETDGGLAFGVDVELFDSVSGGDDPFAERDFAIFISGNFGTVTMGDTDGALDFVMTEAGNVSNPGSINDAETVHLGYLGSYLDGSGDGQIVRYDYAFGALQFAASVEQGDGPDFITDDDNAITWAVGVGYEFEFAGGSVDTGLGYQYSDNGTLNFDFDDAGFPDDLNIATEVETSATGVSAVVNLDAGFSAGLAYTLFDFDGLDKNVHHTGLGLGYSFDAFSVHANYGQYATPVAELRGYGLSAGYDLGGGASILAGYSRSEASDFATDDTTFVNDLTLDLYSVGLSFAF